MKICPVELSCSTWKDRWSNRYDEANSRFSQFCQCTKKWFIIQQHDSSYFIKTQCQKSLEHENFCHLYYKYIYSPPTPPVALRPNAGHALLILEVSRSHTTTHHSR